GDDPVIEAIDLSTANAPTAGPITGDGDVAVGAWNPAARTFSPGGTPSNAVSVTAGRTSGRGNAVELIFGPVLGRETSDVERAAVATVVPASGGDIVPVSLRSPGFGPVDPDIIEHSPGKDGPSKPNNGAEFVPGEEVILFTFGKGKQSPVHLVLDLPGAAIGAISSCRSSKS
ncbi:MAG: TadG family pilus assembly protein, partial [Actinomycetota bacterium]|nr:TadG family pilus assembly protein [Actinomycetota bacterium]